MSFMEPQITEKQVWLMVVGEFGETSYVDEKDVSFEMLMPRELNGEVTIVRTEGFGARMSAPGYMDCTEWSVFDSRVEAAHHLLSTYYDGDFDEMDDDGERRDAMALMDIVNAAD